MRLKPHPAQGSTDLAAQRLTQGLGVTQSDGNLPAFAGRAFKRSKVGTLVAVGEQGHGVGKPLHPPLLWDAQTPWFLLPSAVCAENRCLFHTQNKLFPCSQGGDTSLPHIHQVNAHLQLLQGRERPGIPTAPQTFSTLFPISKKPLCCWRAAWQSRVPESGRAVVGARIRVYLAAGSTSAGCAREKKIN